MFPTSVPLLVLDLYLNLINAASKMKASLLSINFDQITSSLSLTLMTSSSLNSG